MTAAQSFISELIKAANQVDRLSDTEKARLLDRAGRTIQNMRDETGIEGRPPINDAETAWEMGILARRHGNLSNDQIATTLLDAVELIKTLQMALDAKRDTGSKRP